MANNMWIYVDESGWHKPANYFFLLGFMAGDHQWAVIRREWSAIIKEYRVTEFHAHKFFNRQHDQGSDEFDRWSEQKSVTFMGELVKVINSARLHAIGACVNVPVFMSYSTGERKFLTGAKIKKSGKWESSGRPNDPYAFVFHWIIRESLSRTTSKSNIHLVFDDQKEVKGFIEQKYKEIVGGSKKNWPGVEKLAGLHFKDSINEPGVQVADLLYYLWQLDFPDPKRINTMDELAAIEAFKPFDKLQTFQKKEFDEILSKVSEQQQRVMHAEI